MGEGLVKEKSPREIEKAAQQYAHAAQQNFATQYSCGAYDHRSFEV
jgi:hypothetical protein